MEKAYKYLGYFFILLIPLTVVGFYKTYFVQFPHFKENIDIYVHLHAFTAAIWILMLIIQPFLILNKKYSLHRKIGKLSFIVFPLLILSFIPRIIGISQSQDIRNIFYPLADCILLIIFYSLAILNKDKPAKHMRFMIALALVFLGPTIGRIGPILLGLSGILTQFIQYTIIFLILLILILYDKINDREYKPYIVAAIGFTVHMAIFYLVFVY
jgi:hypothetical protein